MVSEEPVTTASASYLSCDVDVAGTWSADAAAAGACGTSRLLDVAEADPGAAIAILLRLGRGEAAVIRRRLVLLDDRPAEVAVSYYPRPLAVGTVLADERRIRGGALRVLREMVPGPLTVQEDVSARPAGPAESTLLQLDPGAWVIVLVRTVLDADTRPVCVEVMTMNAATRHLCYELREQG